MFKKLIAAITFSLASLACGATDANKASEAELTTIKGIGPSTAAKIIQAREHGPFRSWDDLISRVNGIAATSAQKFSDAGLTIDGQGLTTAVPTAPKADAKTNEKTGKSTSPS